MKNPNISLPIVALGLSLSFTGCYTQLATVSEEPSYSVEASPAVSDSLAGLYDDSTADQYYDNDYRRPLIGLRYYSPYLSYDPYYYGYDVYDPYRWGCVAAYPWWMDAPTWGWASYYPSWWYYRPERPFYVGYSGGSWTVNTPSYGSRNSGTRRSGGAERRDYSGGQAMTGGAGFIGGGRAGAARGGVERGTITAPGSAGMSAPRTEARPQAPRQRTSGGERHPQSTSRSWSLPEFFGRASRASGYSAGSDRGSSTPAPAPTYHPEPSYRSAPASSAPAPSSPAPSRDSGGGRSGGETRNSGSTRSGR